MKIEAIVQHLRQLHEVLLTNDFSTLEQDRAVEEAIRLLLAQAQAIKDAIAILKQPS